MGRKRRCKLTFETKWAEESSSSQVVSSKDERKIERNAMSCRSCYVLSPNDPLQRSQNGNQSPSAGRTNSCLNWQFNRNPLLLKAKFGPLDRVLSDFFPLELRLLRPWFQSVMNANADSMLWSLDLRKPMYPLDLLLGAPSQSL